MRIYSLWHRQGVSLLAARHHVTSDLREDNTSRGKEVKKSNTALIWFPHSTDGPAERPVLPLCGCCEWKDGEGTGGWAGRSIIAAEVYISIRMQTMWVPMCPTMRLALTGRGGLCDGGQRETTCCRNVMRLGYEWEGEREMLGKDMI